MLSKPVSWHVEHPYEATIRSVVPTSQYIPEIERCLVEMWVQRQYDYKMYKGKDDSTLFDLELDILAVKRKALEEDMKAEEATFQKLFTRLTELGSPEEASEEDLSDPVSEEEAVKGRRDVVLKGNQPKKNPKLLQKQQAQQAKTLRVSMASSQQKRIDLQAALDETTAKAEAYTRYQKASRFYQKEMCRIALRYKTSEDDTVLIESLHALLEEYHRQLRLDASKEPCRGSEKVCETHFLPFQSTRCCAVKA